MVHLRRADPHAQRLARAGGLHPLARGGPDRRPRGPRAGRGAARVVAARHAACRPVAAPQFRGPENRAAHGGRPPPAGRGVVGAAARRCAAGGQAAAGPAAIRGDVSGASVGPRGAVVRAEFRRVRLSATRDRPSRQLH